MNVVLIYAQVFNFSMEERFEEKASSYLFVEYPPSQFILFTENPVNIISLAGHFSVSNQRNYDTKDEQVRAK